MKTIHCIKIGNTVNISINGKLHKKNCKDEKESNLLIKTVLKAQANPTEENIKAIHMYLNEKTRIAMLCGLESDSDTGEIYLAGFNTPVPQTLIEVIKDYYENEYPLDAIINFWKLLMINPDTRVRTSLFNFIQTHDFVLTDSGYMIVYKAVYYKNKEKIDVLSEYISNQCLKVKKDWKCSPNKYVVYKNLSAGSYEISKIDTVEKWDQKEKNIEVIGKLGDLYAKIITSEEDDNTTVYTDKYTRKMSIKLGQPVKMERKECDSDPRIDCSYGLHCGATRYVNNYGRSADAILACLVNPANVVAVPDYDHSKFRTTEYFPFAIASYIDGKIDIVQEAYYEDDYKTYEIEELEEQINKVRNEELPIEKAIHAEPEERPMSELLKILESRMIDISE